MATYTYTKADVAFPKLWVELAADGAIDESKIKSIEDTGADVVFTTDPALTSGEETALAALVAAHTVSERGDKNFQVKEYNNSGRKILKETWYHTDNGDDTYSDIVEETVYNYSGNKVTSYTVTEYWKDGTVISAETYNYYTNGNKIILKRG